MGEAPGTIRHCLAILILVGAQGSREPARRLDVPGLENVALVAPGLYRGSAPGPKGLDSLRSLGVRTVVNLRHYHGTAEKEACRERGLDYVRIVLESSETPTDEDVRSFLEIATDPLRRPVYVHCWRGKDRTGAMIAAYRMAVEGWSLEEAVREMEDFGFFPGWRDLRRYVEGLAPRVRSVWPPTPGR